VVYRVIWDVDKTKYIKNIVSTTDPALNAIEDIKNNYSSIKHELEFTKSRLSEIEGKSIEVKGIDLSRISSIEGDIRELKTDTIALKQAIDPINPDEILTIARLKDYLKELDKKIETIDERVIKQQKVFQESVLRELKSYNSSIYIILVVLIPIILNFIYTIWKDIKESRRPKPD
jgi:hypothetical protein